MKLFFAELLRLMKKPAFFLAAFLTLGALWIGIGTDTQWLIQGAMTESQFVLAQAFSSKANALSLPLLSALPSAAAVWKELSGGSVRNVLFRSGKTTYFFSRCTVLPLSALSAQLLGILLFLVLVGALTGDFRFPASLILPRLLMTMTFALSGGIGAVIARDSACAYVIPVTLCFSLTILKARFFFNIQALDPLVLLTGAAGTLPILLGLLFLFFFGFLFILMREVRNYV